MARTAGAKRAKLRRIWLHAQQCAEKYPKAFLQEQAAPFNKTHNLVALLELILPFDSNAELMRPALISLTTFAVEVRYPGMSADKADAADALRFCIQVREWARLQLNLPL